MTLRELSRVIKISLHALITCYGIVKQSAANPAKGRLHMRPKTLYLSHLLIAGLLCCFPSCWFSSGAVNFFAPHAGLESTWLMYFIVAAAPYVLLALVLSVTSVVLDHSRLHQRLLIVLTLLCFASGTLAGWLLVRDLDSMLLDPITDRVWLRPSILSWFIGISTGLFTYCLVLAAKPRLQKLLRISSYPA